MVQDVHMPMVATLRAHTTTNADGDGTPTLIKAEDIKLFLPSSLPTNLHVGSLFQSLSSREVLLRTAQADDALSQIRHHRRILMGVTQFCQIHVAGTGQTPNTRMRHLYSKYQGRITSAAARYRAAYKALRVLSPLGAWSNHLRELKDDDIRGPGREDDEPQLGEGDQDISWIWLVPSSGNDVNGDLAFNDSMRVEWCKSQARVQRWEEEYKLVQEEMRRVLEFFEWKVFWWRTQGERRRDVSADIISGLQAYAEKQAHMFHCLAVKFAGKWWPLFTNQKITPSWASKYPEPPAAKVSETATQPVELEEAGENDDENDEEEEEMEAEIDRNGDTDDES